MRRRQSKDACGGRRLPSPDTRDNADSILPCPSAWYHPNRQSGCGRAEREDKQTCRFNFRSTTSTFMSITGWLRSGSFPRTLALS